MSWPSKTSKSGDYKRYGRGACQETRRNSRKVLENVKLLKNFLKKFFIQFFQKTNIQKKNFNFIFLIYIKNYNFLFKILKELSKSHQKIIKN